LPRVATASTIDIDSPAGHAIVDVDVATDHLLVDERGGYPETAHDSSFSRASAIDICTRHLLVGGPQEEPPEAKEIAARVRCPSLNDTFRGG
jgi:hypothetical protein